MDRDRSRIQGRRFLLVLRTIPHNINKSCSSERCTRSKFLRLARRMMQPPDKRPQTQDCQTTADGSASASRKLIGPALICQHRRVPPREIGGTSYFLHSARLLLALSTKPISRVSHEYASYFESPVTVDRVRKPLANPGKSGTANPGKSGAATTSRELVRTIRYPDRSVAVADHSIGQHVAWSRLRETPNAGVNRNSWDGKRGTGNEDGGSFICISYL